MSEEETYKYRNFPSTVVPDDKLWFVSGQDMLVGSGILEWCVDEDDAKDVLSKMQKYSQFKILSAGSWVAEQERCRVALENSN